MMTKQRR